MRFYCRKRWLGVRQSLFSNVFIRVTAEAWDYPEPRKIENRLRAWLNGFELEGTESDQYLGIFMKMFHEFEHRGWICQNPNRPRTRAPCDARAQMIGHIARSETLPIHLEQLHEIVSDFQDRILALRAALRL